MKLKLFEGEIGNRSVIWGVLRIFVILAGVMEVRESILDLESLCCWAACNPCFPFSAFGPSKSKRGTIIILNHAHPIRRYA